MARSLGACLIAVTVTTGLAACTDSTTDSSSTPEPTGSTDSSPVQPVDLTLGVFGDPPEIAAYTQMAKDFDPVNGRANVSVQSWRDHDGLRRAIGDGEPLPDVFMISRRDLRWYTENQLTRPVDTLLDERGVDFGDV